MHIDDLLPGGVLTDGNANMNVQQVQRLLAAYHAHWLPANAPNESRVVTWLMDKLGFDRIDWLAFDEAYTREEVRFIAMKTYIQKAKCENECFEKLWDVARILANVKALFVEVGRTMRNMDPGSTQARTYVPDELRDQDAYERSVENVHNYDSKGKNSFQQLFLHLRSILEGEEFRRKDGNFYKRVEIAGCARANAFEVVISIEKFVQVHTNPNVSFKAWQWSTEPKMCGDSMVDYLKVHPLNEAPDLVEEVNFRSYHGDAFGRGCGVYDSAGDMFYSYREPEQWPAQAQFVNAARARVGYKHETVAPTQRTVAVIHLECAFMFDVVSEVQRYHVHDVWRVWREIDAHERRGRRMIGGEKGAALACAIASRVGTAPPTPDAPLAACNDAVWVCATHDDPDVVDVRLKAGFECAVQCVSAARHQAIVRPGADDVPRPPTSRQWTFHKNDYVDDTIRITEPTLVASVAEHPECVQDPLPSGREWRCVGATEPQYGEPLRACAPLQAALRAGPPALSLAAVDAQKICGTVTADSYVMVDGICWAPPRHRTDGTQWVAAGVVAPPGGVPLRRSGSLEWLLRAHAATRRVDATAVPGELHASNYVAVDGTYWRPVEPDGLRTNHRVAVAGGYYAPGPATPVCIRFVHAYGRQWDALGGNDDGYTLLEHDDLQLALSGGARTFDATELAAMRPVEVHMDHCVADVQNRYFVAEDARGEVWRLAPSRDGRAPLRNEALATTLAADVRRLGCDDLDAMGVVCDDAREWCVDHPANKYYVPTDASDRCTMFVPMVTTPMERRAVFAADEWDGLLTPDEARAIGTAYVVTQDRAFAVDGMARSWKECETDEVDQIYKCQKLQLHDRFFLYALKGRLFFVVGERDGTSATTLLVGVAGCGKSTILIVQMAYWPPHRRGQISSNMQRQFGMSSVAEKDVIFCNEVSSELNIAQEEWQTSVSGEWGSYAVKNQSPLVCKWKGQHFWVGNSMPHADSTGGGGASGKIPWNNNQGQISRRCLGVFMSHYIKYRDAGIPKRMMQKLGALQRREILAYQTYCDMYGDTDPMGQPRELPPAFYDFYLTSRLQSNPFDAFLSDGDYVRVTETGVMPVKVFKERFEDYRLANHISRNVKFAQSSYGNAFSENGIVIRRVAHLEYEGETWTDCDVLYGVERV